MARGYDCTMDATIAGSPLPTRQAIERHALRLRERVLDGECPYPDAIMEANDGFIARLQDCKGQDVAKIAAGHDRKAGRQQSESVALLGAAGIGAFALTFFSIGCAPVAVNAVVAASGVLAVRSLFRLGRLSNASAAQEEKFADQLRAWAQYDSDAAPKVSRWAGPLKTKDLQGLIATFPEDVKPFPYAPELTLEHAHALPAFPAPTRDDETVLETATKLRKTHPSPTSPSRLASLTLRASALVRSAAWMATAASVATAAGLPIAISAGVLAFSTAVHAAVSHVQRAAVPDSERTARSLAYWQQAMNQALAATAPATPEDALFGAHDPQPDPSIERTSSEIRIGNVVVPVQQAQDGGKA